jgi:hypothetical protein
MLGTWFAMVAARAGRTDAAAPAGRSHHDIDEISWSSNVPRDSPSIYVHLWMTTAEGSHRMAEPDVAVRTPAPEAALRRTASFTAEPVPPAPLTWGQRALWKAIQLRGPEQVLMSLPRVVPVPRPAAPAAVLRAVGALVARNSSLRTRIQVVDGEPRQVVSSRDEVPVHLVHADPAGDADGSAAAAAEVSRLATTPFDHGQEFPQRVALVLVDGRVRQICLVFSHTTVDFRAVDIVLGELHELLSSGSIATPAGLQSVDIARREQGEDRHHSERALAYWVDGYGRLPQDTLPRLGPPDTPRFRRAVLTSPAADAAARIVAQRSRATNSTVLLAATAAVISRWSGAGVCGIHSMASNRVRPGYRAAIAKLNQVGLVMVDMTDRPSFAELVPRVRRASMEGYRHSHYDPVEIDDAFAAAGYPSYGDGISPHCFLNDVRRWTPTEPPGDAITEADVRAALSRTSFAVAEGMAHYGWRLRVELLDEFVDDPGDLSVGVTGDTSHLPPADAERFLRDIERLVIDAAFHDLPWPWLSPAT